MSNVSPPRQRKFKVGDHVIVTGPGHYHEGRERLLTSLNPAQATTCTVIVSVSPTAPRRRSSALN